MRNGKKVTSKRLLYPGYVLVQMIMDDQMRHYVKDTPRVTGFVGGGGEPVPLTADEVNKILYRQTTAVSAASEAHVREERNGSHHRWTVHKLHRARWTRSTPERNTLRVLVTIFGRATPVELEFLQVEKTNRPPQGTRAFARNENGKESYWSG